MNEQQALTKMIPPAGHRPSKPYRGGVIQVHVTRACDKSCFACTQGSNLTGKTTFMSPAHFEQALQSLEGYWGVVGVFGGNPALSPHFHDYCLLLQKYFPKEQRGLWCNNPVGKGAIMRETFDPRVSNLNVHLDHCAYREFKRDWPECHPVGLYEDSRHSPPFVAMQDVLKKPCPDCTNPNDPLSRDAPEMCYICDGTGQVYDEERAWELISGCDINQRWSAMVGMFRGELRAWFCEIAGAQSILHQDEPNYPDTGLDPTKDYGQFFIPVRWWELQMPAFAEQVRKHCHECGVPLRGHGELAQADKDPLDGRDSERKEQVSATHQAIYRPKRKGRSVELVTVQGQLGKPLENVVTYLQNARR